MIPEHHPVEQPHHPDTTSEPLWLEGHDLGTMEHDCDGTLEGTTPRAVAPVESAAVVSAGSATWAWLVIPWAAAAVVAAGMLHLPSPELSVVVPVGDVAAVRAALQDHPEGPHEFELRGWYADQLVASGELSDAFEEYLTLVRHAPASEEGRVALADAVLVARRLALDEPVPGEWTERWVAASDRYARYWPADLLAPVFVEEAAATVAEYRHQVEVDRIASYNSYP